MKEYQSTSIALLKIAHKTITNLLPAEDGECFAAAKLAVEYAREWRPKHVRGILLCESHKHTSEEAVKSGPQLRKNLLPEYRGPRGLLFHVCNFFLWTQRMWYKSTAQEFGISSILEIAGDSGIWL